MRNISYFFAFIFLMIHFSLIAQNDKNNDCSTARVVCGNTSIGLDNINGKGINDFANPNNLDGCLAGGEHQSAWYVFYIQTSGVLKLDIIPNVPTDYDFAIFGPNVTCDSLGSPIRCDVSGVQSPTGLKTNGVSPYDDSLQVQAGEFYYLLVDNFQGNSIGFNLEWGGTASFVTTNTTEFTAVANCNKVKFTNKTSFCGAVLSYSWNFGDGSAITSENSLTNPTHSYPSAGNYTATLTVTVLASPTPAEVGTTGTYSLPINIAGNPPPVQITNLQNIYCETANSFDLQATPLGGKYFIKVSGTNFFQETTFFAPALFGVGKHEIKYEYANPANLTCVGVDFRSVEVLAKPDILVTNLGSDYCISSNAFILTAQPAGGTFKINGVATDFFDPAQLGSGVHTIRYEVPNTTTSPCAFFVQRTVRVTQPSDIIINYIDLRPSYCVGITGFVVQVSPIGGTMTINGVLTTNRFFNIQALGAGVHTINYTVRNAGGCVNNKIALVEVTAAPTISIVGLKNAYCKDEPAFTLQGFPEGGTFKINNVSATQFAPATLSVGNYQVEYFYRNPANPTCFNTITQTVKIGLAPTATISTVAPEYCQNSIIEVVPQINVVYGDGTITTLFPPELRFNPQNLPAGDYTITYPLTDPASGCQSIFSYTTKILPFTPVNFVDLKPTYCKGGLPTPLRTNVMGGVFTINNEEVTALNPDKFAAGEVVEIRYDYTHPTSGCPTFAIESVTIIDSPFLTSAQKHKLCPFFQTDYFIEAISEQEEADLIAQGITPTYYWSNDVGNVRKVKIDRIEFEGTFEVFVRDAHTCPLSKRVFEVDIDCEPKLFVPDAFTPNGDNLNPTLKLFGEYVGKLDFKIMNRWGEVIFIGSRLSDTWDGNINGKPAPAGVYVWQANYENLVVRNSRVRKQGKIMLIR